MAPSVEIAPWRVRVAGELVLALLALVVAGSGAERRPIHQPHRTLPSHRGEQKW